MIATDAGHYVNAQKALVGACTLAMLALLGCGGDSESRQSNDSCYDMGQPCVEGRTWETCCTIGTNACRYVFSDGTTFGCDDADDACINAAAEDAAAYCTGHSNP